MALNDSMQQNANKTKLKQLMVLSLSDTDDG